MFQCIFVTLRRRRRRRFFNFFFPFFKQSRRARGIHAREGACLVRVLFPRSENTQKMSAESAYILNSFIRAFIWESAWTFNPRRLFKVDFLTTTFPGSLSSAYLGRHPELAILLVSTKSGDLWEGPTPEARHSRTSYHSAILNAY